MESKIVRYLVEYPHQYSVDGWRVYTVDLDETQAKTDAKTVAALYGEARITKETTVITSEVIGKMVKNGGKQCQN